MLFEIDPDTYRVALNQAKAKLAQTEAELKIAETQLARTEKLFKQGYASEKSRDDAVAQRRLAEGGAAVGTGGGGRGAA